MGGQERQLTDLQRAHDIFLVSDRFRQVVEKLEPGVHLFAPVELVWEDGSHAASFFWFYPCSRVDGIDREAAPQDRVQSGDTALEIVELDGLRVARIKLQNGVTSV